MARELSVLDLTFKAEQTFASGQFYFCELSAADQVDICDSTADLPLGVIQNKPAAGQAADIRIHGVTKIVADGTVTAVGNYVGTGNTGKGVKKTADKAIIRGIALSASSVDGVIIDILLVGPFTLSV